MYKRIFSLLVVAMMFCSSLLLAIVWTFSYRNESMGRLTKDLADHVFQNSIVAIDAPENRIYTGTQCFSLLRRVLRSIKATQNELLMIEGIPFGSFASQADFIVSIGIRAEEILFRNVFLGIFYREHVLSFSFSRIIKASKDVAVENLAAEFVRRIFYQTLDPAYLASSALLRPSDIRTILKQYIGPQAHYPIALFIKSPKHPRRASKICVVGFLEYILYSLERLAIEYQIALNMSKPAAPRTSSGILGY